ncbi:MAG: hypothetical protein JWN69_2221 [Alphaproteobacteria bacterium]|nr:hypothetical protein [Alphaproteobacteria bacterium]
MRRLIGAAALLVPLALSTPSQAQKVGAIAGPPNGAWAAGASSAPRSAKRGKPTLFTQDMSPGQASPYAEPSGRGRTMLFGGWQPSQTMTFGVGLFSVPKSATADQQEVRVDPMKDPSGKSSRVAAVGLNLAF